MENLSKKVGYLKGLLEGAEVDQTTVNGKLLSGIVDLLGDLSDRVETMDEVLDDLNDYVESIDDDLADLEGEHRDNDFPFLDDDEDEDFDDAFGDGEDRLHLLRPDEEPVPEAGDGDVNTDAEGPEALAGKLCPKCSRMFFAALEDDENAEYICPHCGERIHAIPLTPENAPMASPIQDD